jgi:Glycosyltransferase family 87
MKKVTEQVFKSISSNSLVGLIYVAAIVFITYRNLSMPWGDLFADGGFYSHYNNYIIFKQSFFHLIKHQDLYIHYPQEQYDLFKYPPTFALLFAPFSMLPDSMGYTLWTAINILLPVFAIFRLQGVSNKGKVGLSTLLLLEGFTSALNSQSNGLMLGLLLFAFVALQNGKISQAVLCIWLTAFIKLFGVLFFAMLLVFPGAFRRSLVRIPVIFVVLYLLPLPVLGWDGLQQQYASMFNLLAHDHGYFVKYSVMGWLQQWFGLRPNKNLVLLAGLCIQILPLLMLIIKQKMWQTNTLSSISANLLDRWQRLFAASWLLWMVVFNHMAESATYVIAVGGAVVALMTMMSPLVSDNEPTSFKGIRRICFAHWPWTLGLLMLICWTILGPTDIYPKAIRIWIVETAQLKAFPCIYLWVISIVKLMKGISKDEI